MKRLLTGLLAGVLTATLVGVSLAWMLSAQQRSQPATPAMADTKVVQQLRGEYLRLAHERVRDLCERDVRVERLGLELASLGPAMEDASPTARVLAKTHGQQIWLLQQSGDALRELGASRKPLLEKPTLDTLTRASESPLSVGNSGSAQLFACRRPSSGGALWILQSLDTAELGKLQEPTRGTAPDHLGLLLALVMGAGCVGGALGLLLTRPQPVDDAVLAELERAATRVAEGDLTSTINLRVGGKADQTFRSFDRMTRELREMRVRLAEAERAAAFQDIARRIAHEIKNPLSPIQLAMETLRKAHAKRIAGFDEIFEESTRTVLEEVRRMERIVREFSEFARLPKPQPGALALASLVEEVAQLYRPEDVALTVASGGQLPDVRVDREQITQVLVNLLQNAFDAARTGGATSPQVRVAVRMEDSRVVLDVDDNGPGVPESERDRIFEPYVTTKAQGTGLGLAIVKRIVSDHDAELHVDKAPLGGARFSVRFPVTGTADHSVSIP